MARPTSETWEIWYPKAGATGIPIARGSIGQPVAVILVHAGPPILTVTVRNAEGLPIAEGMDLAATAETPMVRLTRDGDRVLREDIWPGAQDIGRLVLLVGGEVGTLKQWWHAEDHSEWRWSIELYNHR
jgi:hypothetical protein